VKNPEGEGSRARWGDSSRRAVDAIARAMDDDDDGTRCEFRFFESRRRRRRPSRSRRGTEDDDAGRLSIAVGGGERGVG